MFTFYCYFLVAALASLFMLAIRFSKVNRPGLPSVNKQGWVNMDFVIAGGPGTFPAEQAKDMVFICLALFNWSPQYNHLKSGLPRINTYPDSVPPVCFLSLPTMNMILMQENQCTNSPPLQYTSPTCFKPLVVLASTMHAGKETEEQKLFWIIIWTELPLHIME